MASGRVVRASRHRHRAAIRQGEKSKGTPEVQLPNLTLAIAAGERGDERCGSGPAHRPFERRLASIGIGVECSPLSSLHLHYFHE